MLREMIWTSNLAGAVDFKVIHICSGNSNVFRDAIESHEMSCWCTASGAFLG